MLRKNVIIYIVIFLLAFSLRLIAISNYSLPLGGDELCYNALAISISSEGRYYIEGATYSRPPIYPFFISVIYSLFGYNLIAVRITQAILDSLLCILIYSLCFRLFNRSVALIASFSSLIYLLFIKGVSHILTESFFTFILFLAIVYIFKSKERLSYFNAIMIGLLIAILTLTKGIMLLFLPFLLIILLTIKYYKFIKAKELAKRTAVMVVAFLIPISVWTYRNYKVYNAFVPISTQGGYALYDSYFPRDGKIFGVNAMDDNVRYAMSLKSQTKMSSYLTGKTIEFIRNNPRKVLRLELLKFLYFWCPFDWEIMWVEKGIYNFQYVFMLPFSIFGIFLLLRELNKYAPLYIPIGYIFLMSLLFYGSPRFRMPVEPYLVIFFGIGILRFFKMFKNRYIPAIISASYAFINFMMYLNSDSVKYCFKNTLTSIGLW